MAETNTTTAQKALVVCQATYLDIDKLCSALVLGKIICRKLGQNVDIYFGVNPVPKEEITQIVAPQGINFLENLEGNYFTVEVDKGDAIVREVRWEDNSGKLKLMIFTEAGEIPEKAYPATGGARQYDFIYTLGIHNQEHIEKVMNKYVSVWESAGTTISIDNKAHSQNFAKANHNFPDSKSFAEAVAQFAQAEDLEITGSDATELLSCIYWKTSSLRNKYTTAHTFTHISQLINRGADIQLAGERIYSTISFSEAKARAEIYGSMKLTSDNLAFAQVTKDTAKLLSRIRPIHPEKNPLFQLKDAIASFVLIPSGEKETLVLASSRSDKISFRHLFTNNQLVGEPLQSEFVLNLNVTDAEEFINKKVAGVTIVSEGSRQVATNPEPEPQPMSAEEEKDLLESIAWQEGEFVEPEMVAEPVNPERHPEALEGDATQEKVGDENEKEEKQEQKTDVPNPNPDPDPDPDPDPELLSSEESGDPLPKATSEIKAAEPEEDESASAPNPFGGFGGGFGGMTPGAPQANPLPPAKS